MGQLIDIRNIQGLTPEQKIFIQWFYSKFNINLIPNLALPRKIKNVEPLFYEGNLSLAPFKAYHINELFIFLDSEFTPDVDDNFPNNYQMFIYGENNTVIHRILNNSIDYDIGNGFVGHDQNTVQSKNFYASCILHADYVIDVACKVIGYKITLE